MSVGEIVLVSALGAGAAIAIIRMLRQLWGDQSPFDGDDEFDRRAQEQFRRRRTDEERRRTEEIRAREAHRDP